MDYDVALWTSIRDEARRGVGRTLPALVQGSDVRGDAVSFAINNARAAGIGHLLRFEKRGLRDFHPPAGPPGLIVCNPPYGERIGEEKELRGLYQLLGEVFIQRCAGWSLFVFTGNRVLADAIGLEPTAQVPLFNGKIPCRLLTFTSPSP
jgi:putative N6-adenine-specific DNA methylase